MFRLIAYYLFVILFVYCTLSVAYLFLLSFLGRFFPRLKKDSPPLAPPGKKIAVLVPAFMEDNVILFTTDNLLRLDYPRELHDIYIIADSFLPATLEQLNQLPVTVFDIALEKSTKTKALNEAFRRIGKDYDIALICDGDNMLEKDFLRKVNDAFVKGARAIQGRRVAKNLDSSFAILDACSEAINNHIFRKGTNALGLSSSICGSGMAFEFATVKEMLGNIDAVGGFDKVLQLKITQENTFIDYLDHALIFDEKVGSSQAYMRQRKRWISSQVKYSKVFFFQAFRELFKGNFSYFNLAVGNYWTPPKAFLLVFLPLLTLAGFCFRNALGIEASILWLFYILSILIALPQVLVNRDLLHAVARTLPRMVGLMFKAFVQSRRANESFIHTIHTKTGITNSGKSRI